MVAVNDVLLDTSATDRIVQEGKFKSISVFTYKLYDMKYSIS